MSRRERWHSSDNPLTRKRVVNIAMDDVLADALHNYAVRAGHHSLNDAGRELLNIGLAATPEEGVVMAIRDRVCRELRKYGMDRMTVFFAELEREIKTVNVRENGDGR